MTRRPGRKPTTQNPFETDNPPAEHPQSTEPSDQQPSAPAVADAPPLPDRPADDTDSVSQDRAGQLSEEDRTAAEIERALNEQDVVTGAPGVTPDRVGEWSKEDKEARRLAPDQADPERMDREQAETDARRKRRLAAANQDWTPPVRCKVVGCILPEFIENATLCGPHWALRPDMRPKDVRTTERKAEPSNDS